MKIKKHFSTQIERAKNEISIPEYIIWWVMRAMMVVALVSMIMGDRSFMSCLMVGANLAIMFIIPLISALVPNKFYFGRIPFRVQTYVDMFVIAGSFMGHFIDLYRFEGVYDKTLHIVSGFVTVFIGYELMKAIAPEKKLMKKHAAFGGFMFSYFVMIMWEVFEFFSDFILDSNNQGFTPRFCEKVYTDDYFFFKIFGRGNAGVDQLPVLDTMIDIIAAVIGSFVALALLMIFVKEKKESKEKPVEEETEKEEVTV